MELIEAQQVAQRAGIDVEFVLREEWELLFLAEVAQLSDPEWIFRGGTALRLAYGSPRFSVDLDFSTAGPLEKARFEKVVRAFATRFREVEVRDLWSKRFTHLADFRVRGRGYARPIGLKIEVSRRTPYPPRSSYAPTSVRSDHTNVRAIVLVARLEQLLQEKRAAFEARQRPLDLFDLWFLHEKLGRAFKPPRHSISRVSLRRDLRKYLPASMYKVIDLLISENV